MRPYRKACFVVSYGVFVVIKSQPKSITSLSHVSNFRAFDTKKVIHHIRRVTVKGTGSKFNPRRSVSKMSGTNYKGTKLAPGSTTRTVASGRNVAKWFGSANNRP